MTKRKQDGRVLYGMYCRDNRLEDLYVVFGVPCAKSYNDLSIDPGVRFLITHWEVLFCETVVRRRQSVESGLIYGKGIISSLNV